MWVLKTEDNVPAPVSYRILPGNTRTIGRAPGADFIVDASLVSRLHCRLVAGATDLEVADLESTNGTYVNGRRIGRALLQPGDRLAVGKVELVVSRG